jgi:hypothetical protein
MILSSCLPVLFFARVGVDAIEFIIAIACQTGLKVDVFCLGGSQARCAVRGEGHGMRGLERGFVKRIDVLLVFFYVLDHFLLLE